MLHPTTVIPLVDGTYRLAQDLYRAPKPLYCWGSDLYGVIRADRIKSVTQYPVSVWFRITLHSGASCMVSGDHLFSHMLGHPVGVGDLEYETPLFPFSLKLSKNGIDKLYQPLHGKNQKLYMVVLNSGYCDEFSELRRIADYKGMYAPIAYKDGDRYNVTPENLILVKQLPSWLLDIVPDYKKHQEHLAHGFMMVLNWVKSIERVEDGFNVGYGIELERFHNYALSCGVFSECER